MCPAEGWVTDPSGKASQRFGHAPSGACRRTAGRGRRGSLPFSLSATPSPVADTTSGRRHEQQRAGDRGARVRRPGRPGGRPQRWPPSSTCSTAPTAGRCTARSAAPPSGRLPPRRCRARAASAPFRCARCSRRRWPARSAAPSPRRAGGPASPAPAPGRLSAAGPAGGALGCRPAGRVPGLAPVARPAARPAAPAAGRARRPRPAPPARRARRIALWGAGPDGEYLAWGGPAPRRPRKPLADRPVVLREMPSTPTIPPPDRPAASSPAAALPPRGPASTGPRWMPPVPRGAVAVPGVRPRGRPERSRATGWPPQVPGRCHRTVRARGDPLPVRARGSPRRRDDPGPAAPPELVP